MAEARTNGSTHTRTQSHKARTRSKKSERWLEGQGARPSKQLLGVLPVARVIPQDVHSVFDYVGAVSCASAAFFADTTSGKAVSLSIGASDAVASAMTDYRLSVAKVLPIEVHEVLDYVSGISQIVAPFLFGYWKKDRVTSLMHIINGASLVLVSMLTDYRAAKGVGGRNIGI
jgi:hypothetical protein